jgi:15-cis-phytoene synthase
MNLYDEISFKTSKLITRKYSTSFSVAVSLLPAEMQQAIYSIYGFVRLADEIVDTFHNVNQERILEDFERDYFKALSDGISMNPVLQAFTLTVKKYNIPADLVDSFLKSMKADLYKQKYYSTDELNEYIYGSADVVGLMCLNVFVNGDRQLYEELKSPAMKLGSAFQKVNFLRDMKADTEELNRSYFPEFSLNSFNEDIKYQLIESIESDFREAKRGIRKLPGKSKLAVYIAFIYYKRLLHNLKLTPAEKILSARIRISNHKKMFLLGASYIKYKLNMI